MRSGDRPAKGPVWRSTSSFSQRTKSGSGEQGSLAAAFDSWMHDLDAPGSEGVPAAETTSVAELLATTTLAAPNRRRRQMRKVSLEHLPRFAEGTASMRKMSEAQTMQRNEAWARETSRRRNLEWQKSQRKAFRHLGRALAQGPGAKQGGARACGGDYCKTAQRGADRAVAHQVSVKLILEDRVERGVKERMTAKDRSRMYDYVGVCNACYVQYQRKAHEELLQERERALEAKLAAAEQVLVLQRQRELERVRAEEEAAANSAAALEALELSEAQEQAAEEAKARAEANTKWKLQFSNRISSFYQAGLKEEIHSARPNLKMQCPPEGSTDGAVRFFRANPFLAHRCSGCGCHIDIHKPELALTELLTVDIRGKTVEEERAAVAALAAGISEPVSLRPAPQLGGGGGGVAASGAASADGNSAVKLFQSAIE